jgi:ABC-2 type transport system ATP-binding protein
VTTADPGAGDRFESLAHVESVSGESGRFIIRGRGEDLVTRVIHILAEHRISVADFRVERPTLEDVFLRLTGHGIRD